MRSNRSVAVRCHTGGVPASVTSPGSPPHSSRTIAVAASTASGISAGSMPRSKRWRASETMSWRRPVSATRIGIEQRALDEHRRRGCVAARCLTADHAGHRLHAGRIRDRAILGGHRVVAPVQRPECLAATRAQRQHVAGQLRHVEHVQRTAEVDGEEVGDIDQRVDRPQADRRQPLLQPWRAGPVAQVADGAAEDPRARLRPVDLPARATANTGATFAGCHGFSVPTPGSGQIARDAAHGKAVAAIRRDADIDHRVVETRPLRRRARRPAHRPADRGCRRGPRRDPARVRIAACRRCGRRGFRRPSA